jgi:hypothetical protein
MSDKITGGCLCGAVRYEAVGGPAHAGLCYCRDCRKASGAGFMPFMGFAASQLTITGETRLHRSPSIRGSDAVRNFCASCGALVFGGIVGVDDSHTIYAGSLDEPQHFQPQIAIFVRDRPAWAATRSELKEFATMPGL